MPGGVGRQRKQRPARLGLDCWGRPESPARHLPALVYQLAGLEPGPLLFPPYPTEACGAASSLGLPPPPADQEPGPQVRAVRVETHNSRRRPANRRGAVQGRGGTSARGCCGAPSGDGDPSQPGGVITGPPAESWPLCGQALLGPERPGSWSRGAEAQPAGGELGVWEQAGLTHLHSSRGALLDVWVRWVSKTPAALPQ